MFVLVLGTVPAILLASVDFGLPSRRAIDESEPRVSAVLYVDYCTTMKSLCTNSATRVLERTTGRMLCSANSLE